MEKEHLTLNNFLVMDTNTGKVFEDKNIEFPFKTSLSFEKLILHIKSVADCGDEIKKSFAKSILAEYNNAKEIHGQITDMSSLTKYEKLIDTMMMFVFPSAFGDKQMFAAFRPYSDDLVYASPKFKETITITDGYIEGELNIDQTSYEIGKTTIAFIGVLAKFYQVDLNFDFPLVYRMVDPVTGLDRYLKLNAANEFADIIPNKKVKKLSESEIESIRANIFNLEYVKSMIEPENFTYSGFVVMNFINITDTEILSAIKKDLIEKDTLNTQAGFLKLQRKIKSLLKCPDLQLGIADYPGSHKSLCEFGRKIGNSFLLNDICRHKFCSIKDSLYSNSLETGKAIIIEDLSKYPDKTLI